MRNLTICHSQHSEILFLPENRLLPPHKNILKMSNIKGILLGTVDDIKMNKSVLARDKNFIGPHIDLRLLSSPK